VSDTDGSYMLAMVMLISLNSAVFFVLGLLVGWWLS
jgi:hypothetical protein